MIVTISTLQKGYITAETQRSQRRLPYHVTLLRRAFVFLLPVRPASQR